MGSAARPHHALEGGVRARHLRRMRCSEAAGGASYPIVRVEVGDEMAHDRVTSDGVQEDQSLRLLLHYPLSSHSLALRRYRPRPLADLLSSHS